jgi:hypothetical protein
MPLVYNFESLLHAKGPQYYSPLDFLLPLLLVLLGVDLAMKKPWARLKIPPAATLFWAGLALLSPVLTGGEGSILPKAALSIVLFGTLAVWVFENIAADAAEYRRLTLILLASFGACVLLALKQYAGPQGIPFDPDNQTQDLGGATAVRVAGWYGYRAAFGAQVALLVPAAAAVAFWDANAIVRWASGVVAVLALCVTLAASGLWGACAGILAVACACAAARRWLTALTMLAVLLGLICVVLPRLPRENMKVIARGSALFADDQDGNRKPTARLRRYQAALDLLSCPSNPRDEQSPPTWLKGVGVGRYQERVNRFYHTTAYPKPGRRTDDEAAYDMESDERFSFSLLETTAVELGLPGLLALLFVFGAWIFGAHLSFAKLEASASPAARVSAMLALAALGSGCGAVVLAALGNPMLPGVRGTFAFMLALAFCVARWASGTCGNSVASRPQVETETAGSR